MYHIPVLKDEILKNLPNKTEYFFDWTLGHGGHALFILKEKKEIRKYFWIDRDEQVLSIARERLKEFADKIIFLNDSYASIDDISTKYNVKFDWILLDLGVNMQHFKDADRWFSIKQDWPLDMRFTKDLKQTAADILNGYDVNSLTEILVKYWDFSEKFAFYLAKEIISYRKKSLFTSTFQLKDFLKKHKLNEKKIAVFFQCLRIEVNDELKHLEEFLDKFINFLNKGWRCFIISYHSIEDRLVKYKFKELVSLGYVNLVNKHVIKPSRQEIKSNKAARSAKLRILEKIT